jgi:hypothetical protein
MCIKIIDILHAVELDCIVFPEGFLKHGGSVEVVLRFQEVLLKAHHPIFDIRI